MGNKEQDITQPYIIIKSDKTRILLICDHASNIIPSKYANLGLSEKLLSEHISYDIGAAGLTQKMANLMNSQAILSNFSRLLIDPNRSIDDPTSIMRFADKFIIPGNRSITDQDAMLRIDQFYNQYHNKIEEVIISLLNDNIVPILISIHSFTRKFRDKIRPWEISILWDSDDRISASLIDLLERDNNYVIGNNQPYKGYLRGDTLYTHATSRGLPHVLIEIRNDLIADDDGQEKIANYLTKKLCQVISINHKNLSKMKYYGTKSI
ncbi:MAG: N-formylglutamate amidohydrolase [Rhodobiaceae bacterium]|nr:N-formylglutamate amidohydrolase [Rhodobiaceae bacterium]|tara:strand:+ start:1022 stop:1819 length:798 start_codon:yes stop_codon:yes gene_type:complete